MITSASTPFADARGRTKPTDTAAALVIVEHGTGPEGGRVEHELVVLAG
jgi:hypothetical protein